MTAALVVLAAYEESKLNRIPCNAAVGFRVTCGG